MSKAEERSAARDYVMARLAACRASLANACQGLDMALTHFVDPSEDLKGKERKDLLEQIEDDIGAAALSVHAAMDVWPDMDPEEGEPEPEEPEEDDDEEEDREDEGEEGGEDEGDRGRRRRR